MTDYASGITADGKHAYDRLFSRDGGVFSQCRAEVADGLRPGWASGILGQLPLIHRHERGNGLLAERAVKAVIDLAEYAANRGTTTSLEEAATALSASTVAVADPGGASRWLRDQGIDRDEAMRPVLARDPGIAAMLGLWAKMLSGEIPEPGGAASSGIWARVLRSVNLEPGDKNIAVVPAMLSLQQFGTVGTIRVALVPGGPPGLYPDPSAIAVTAFDERFRASVTNAWDARTIPGSCVVWSVDVQPNDAFYGDSAGAAFALALDELQRRMGRFGRVRFRRFRKSYVISAALEGSQGELHGVSELEVKFKAAADAKMKHVVLSEQNRRDGTEGTVQSGLDVRYARTLNEAIAITRRLNPVFLVTLGASLFTLLALAVGGTVAANAISDANQRATAGKLLSTAGTLQRLAQQTGTLTLPDLQAKAQYLLAAHDLALRAGRPDLASQIVGSNLRSSPGIIATLNADLGAITGMYQVAGEIVVTSDKGKVTLIDDQSLAVLGTYTVPPGTETLNQPMIKAVAGSPYTRDFAAVSQVPSGIAAPQDATLDIFSGGGALTHLGASAGFTRDQVRELSYSPGGDTLVAVTATRAFFWDVTSAKPRLTGSCAISGQKGAIPVGLYPDPKTRKPLIAESDSSIRALPSWSVTGTESTCEATEVTAAWAGKLAKLDSSQVSQPTIVAGTSTYSGTMIAAITAQGQVKVRNMASGRVITLPISSPATNLGGPYGSYVAVQVRTSKGTAIQVWDWDAATGTKPVLETTYPGLQLPGSFPGGTALATSPSGHVIEALSDQEMTYPAGLLTFSHRASDATAAGRSTFAVLNTRTISVYSSGPRKQPVYLSLPPGYNLATGDGRFDNSLAISQDGQYVAGVLHEGASFGNQNSSALRKVVVWDVATGVSTDITGKLGTPSPRHRALDIRFAPGTHDVLVDYADGTLELVHPTSGTWAVASLLRAASDVFMFGMDTGPGGIYVIERRTLPGSATADDRVVRLSYQGSQLQAWDFSSLHINEPSIVPLSDQGVLLIDTGGTAYRLRPGGAIGKPVDLNTQYVTEARQIPGTQEVLIATQGTAENYDLAHDVLAAGESVGNSSHGVWDNFAVTTDGRYLLGSDMLNFDMGIAALAPQDRLANLCDLAGGSGMSPQEWAANIGNLAPYSDPCAGNRSAVSTLYNLAQQGEFAYPPQIVQTPTSTAATAYGASCAHPSQTGFSAEGSFAWGEVDGTEVVCVNQTVKWVVPRASDGAVSAGKVGGQPVLAVTGKFTPSAGSTADTNTDILFPDAMAASVNTTDGTASVTPRGVQITETLGAVRVRDIIGPNQHGYWQLESAIPAGHA